MGGTNIWTQAAGSRARAANHHIHSLSGPYAWLPQYAAVGLLAPSVARCAPWIPGAISPFASGHSIGRGYQGCGGERDLILCVAGGRGCLEPHGAQGQRHQLSNSCSDGCGVQNSMYRLDPGRDNREKQVILFSHLPMPAST